MREKSLAQFAVAAMFSTVSDETCPDIKLIIFIFKLPSV